MKYLNSLILLFMFTASLCLVGCSDDDKEKAIIVDNGSSLVQDVYADKTEGSGVSFTTTGPWTSSIKAKAATRDAATEPTDWVSLSPNSGSKAGSYTIAINLEPNTTGADRSATITIHCDGTEITINVTQKGVKEDGNVLGKAITFNVYRCNEEWMPNNDIPYLAVKDAEVKVYNLSDSTLVGIYTTDENGVAEARLEDGEYFYTAEKGEEKNIDPYYGFILAGIYTTDGRLGHLKFCDINGDGMINDEDRAGVAKITVSQKESIDVYISSGNFTPVIYDRGILSDNLMRLRGYFLKRIITESYQIDAAITREAALSAPYNAFSSYSFNASSAPIDSLWNKTFDLIKETNRIYEKINNYSVGIPEDEKSDGKATASFFRIYAYSILVNYFGEVPLHTTSTFESTPKSTIQEIVNFIFDEGDYVADNVKNPMYKYSAFQVMARVAINKQDFADAYNLTKRIMDDAINQLPSEGSAIFQGPGIRFPDNTMNKYGEFGGYALIPFNETLLINAEAALGLDKNTEAIQIVNSFAQVDNKPPYLSQGASKAEIQSVIASLWKEKLDKEGHTFARLKRTNTFLSTLSSYGATQKHLLLPIPTSALTDKVTQNPGW